MSQIPKEIDKYKILSIHGSGQAGTVYKAIDTEIDREVAIKVLKAEFIGSQAVRAQAAERFQREIRAIGKLSHPNIIQIFDAGNTTQGIPYFVMNFIEGKGLDVVVSQDKPLDTLRALLILEQLAAALDYAHSQDVIHRDIKPSNIILDKEDKAYLLDFSTAILTDTTLTPMGQVVGTPQYMAPEVIKGERAGPRADIYSLSVVAYQLFTGKKPYKNSGIAATFSSIVNDSPLSFKELECSLGAGLERVLRRGLAKNPQDRYATGSEFILAVREGLERSNADLFGDQKSSDSGTYNTMTRSSGAFKTATSGIYSRPPQRNLKKLFGIIAAFAVMACVAAAFLFFLVFDFRSNLAIWFRGAFHVGFSQSELSKLNSEDLARVFSSKMPERTTAIGLVELLKRDNPTTATAILNLTKSSSVFIRSEAIKAMLLSTSISEAQRLEIFQNALHDEDRFIRIFAAFELLRPKAKEAQDLIKKQRAIESDPMVVRVLEGMIK